MGSSKDIPFNEERKFSTWSTWTGIVGSGAVLVTIISYFIAYYLFFVPMKTEMTNLREEHSHVMAKYHSLKEIKAELDTWIRETVALTGQVHEHHYYQMMHILKQRGSRGYVRYARRMKKKMTKCGREYNKRVQRSLVDSFIVSRVTILPKQSSMIVEWKDKKLNKHRDTLYFHCQSLTHVFFMKDKVESVVIDMKTRR